MSTHLIQVLPFSLAGDTGIYSKLLGFDLCGKWPPYLQWMFPPSPRPSSLPFMQDGLLL
jgi:hypothetical protein